MNEGIKSFNSFAIVVHRLCHCLSWLYLKIKKKDVFYTFLLRNIERAEMRFTKRTLDKTHKYSLFVHRAI